MTAGQVSDYTGASALLDSLSMAHVEGSKNRELKTFLPDFGVGRLVLKVLDDDFRSTF